MDSNKTYQKCHSDNVVFRNCFFYADVLQEARGDM